MNVKAIVIPIVTGVLAFVIGIAAGIFYQGSHVVVAPVQNTVPVMPKIVKDLSNSNNIIALFAFGTITKIDGRNITLTFSTRSATVSIGSDAKIYSSVVDPKNKALNKTTLIDFKDLKVGDNVNLNIRVLPNGQMEGFYMTVLPAALTPATTPAATGK